jgi:hypothetical protein
LICTSFIIWHTITLREYVLALNHQNNIEMAQGTFPFQNPFLHFSNRVLYLTKIPLIAYLFGSGAPIEEHLQLF